MLLIGFGFLANAQSLRLFKEDSTVINNNDVVDVILNGEEEVNTYVGYENLTNQQIGFYVKKEVLSFNDDGNVMLLFCIGNCYTGVSSELVTIEPNAVIPANHSMAFHATYQGRPSDALVKYTFQNAENEDDCISFTIKYKTGVGIPQNEIANKLQASPNPATNNVSINYTTASNKSSLVIKNLTGKEIYRTELQEGTSNLNLNISDFPAGVYFYGIEVGGKMICTKKLLIK